MLRRLASGAALAAVAAVVLAGCTPPEPVETTSAPAETSPSAGSPPPSGSLDEEAFEAAALAVAQEFVALVDEGFANAALPREELQSVATPAAIDKVQGELDQFVALRWRIEGSSLVDSPSLIGWDGPDQVRGNAQLLACLDTSGVNTTDANGEPAGGDDARQPRLFTIEYERDDLLVSDVSPVENSMELAGCGS